MQNQFVDLYRNGIKTAAEVAKLSLENSIRLQEKQLDIVRGMAEAKTTEEVLGRVADFWSSFWQLAVENQKALIQQMQSQIGQATDSLRDMQSFAARSSEDVARAAANQVSRAAGSIRESVPQERKPHEGHRKSA